MIFASRSLLRWPVLLLVTGNSQCPPSSLVWVWKTWIITPELKLILVKTSLDLAGNIKYSQSTQGIIFHNNRLRVRGIFVFQCLCNVQYAWHADKDWWRLLSLLSVIPDFDPNIWPGRHQHRTLYPLYWADAWQSDNLRSPEYQIVFRCRVSRYNNALSDETSQLPCRECEKASPGYKLSC